jgi:hypothetical protein
MDADEYRRALESLGLKQTGENGAGVFLGVDDRTSRRWATDGPPRAVAMLLRLMIARRIKPETVKARYGQ